MDLDASFAYGDSVNDGPMLESVGHPAAINPDTKLRKLATSRGWRIEEFRSRRKNGRRGIIKASLTGTVWAGMAVARGVRGGARGVVQGLKRSKKADAASQDHVEQASGRPWGHSGTPTRHAHTSKIEVASKHG